MLASPAHCALSWQADVHLQAHGGNLQYGKFLLSMPTPSCPVISCFSQARLMLLRCVDPCTSGAQQGVPNDHELVETAEEQLACH